MFIDGPTGRLEAEIDEATEASGSAILCHPHPQYGGSMHDNVLQIASQTLRLKHLDCLRFNFRGVGQSEGHFDNGEGECQDLLAAIQWSEKSGSAKNGSAKNGLVKNSPAENGVAGSKPATKPWLLGYSFGANVVWNTLAYLKPGQVAGAILVAPPVGKMHFAAHAIADLPCEVFAVAGNRDEFVDQTAFNEWSGVNSQLIDGADHFFMQQAKELAKALDQFIC